MKYLVTKNPEIAGVLVPWFVISHGQTRDSMFRELVERLVCWPEETFVCLAVKADKIKGFVVAYCRDRKDVFLWQARSEGMSRNEVDVAFNSIEKWAKGIGIRRLIAAPNRALKLWCRRWGFSQLNEEEVYKEI